MTDQRDEAAEMPVGAVDASGEPIDVAGITPPEQPPMLDDDGDGEINGTGRDGEPGDEELQVQGGE